MTPAQIPIGRDARAAAYAGLLAEAHGTLLREYERHVPDVHGLCVACAEEGIEFRRDLGMCPESRWLLWARLMIRYPERYEPP